MWKNILFLGVLFFVSCQDTYVQSIEQWRTDRYRELKAPYGWPSVTGLFHLRNTYGYFGRSDQNDFIIPNGPSSFGILKKTDTAIVMTTYQSVPVMIDSQIVRKAVLYSDRHPKGPTIASYQSIQWHVIERDSQFYLRVKDTLSPYRQALEPLPYFPIDRKYVIKALKTEHSSRPKTITYKNVLGMEITNPVAAYLSFEWEGKNYELTALENDEQTYFVMVHDATTGNDTYGGGRYLYPEKANEAGEVTLDFNKLFNPPCVFTPYATCPIPPESNHLPFPIHAGEKVIHLY